MSITHLEEAIQSVTLREQPEILVTPEDEIASAMAHLLMLLLRRFRTERIGLIDTEDDKALPNGKPLVPYVS